MKCFRQTYLHALFAVCQLIMPSRLLFWSDTAIPTASATKGRVIRWAWPGLGAWLLHPHPASGCLDSRSGPETVLGGVLCVWGIGSGHVLSDDGPK